MTKREAKARFLLGRLDGIRSDALDQQAVDLAEIVADLIFLLVPEANAAMECGKLCHSPGGFDGPCTKLVDHKGGCNPLPF